VLDGVSVYAGCTGFAPTELSWMSWMSWSVLDELDELDELDRMRWIRAR